MNLPRRSLALAIPFSLLCGLGAHGAAAQSPSDFPSQAIRVIVPAPPGGANDIIARILTNKLLELSGQPWVVDNRPGASGNVAIDAVLRAPADGYTMHVGNAVTYITNQHMFKGMKFNPMRDTTPVAMMGQIANGLVVPSNSPFQSFADLIAYAKANPGKLNYGTGGNGTSPHLFMELIKKRAGVNIVHVPFKGSSQMLPELIAGRIDVSLENLPVILGPAKAGQVRILAVTSPEPWPYAPEIPTLQSQGIQDINVLSWFGMFVPTATPLATREAINRLFNKALADPAVIRQLAAVGVKPVPGTLPQIATFIDGERKLWEDAVRASGAQID